VISIEDILDRIGEIQPLPETVLRLINVLNDMNSTIHHIVETIKYDQAITAQMLRLCNSAYFGLSREVHSINDALRYLGSIKVFQLIMAIHSNSMLSKEQTGYGLPPGILWKHSASVALASSEFAQRINPSNTGMAFTAGLLHDIGKVILNEYVAAEFVEITRRISEQKISFVEAERETIGFSHEEIGAMIGEKWHLPPIMIRCIRYHHSPSALDPPDPLVDIVYLSDCVCMLLGIGLGSDGLCYRADSEVMERYDLQESDLEFVGVQVMSELKKIEEIFSGNFTQKSDLQSVT